MYNNPLHILPQPVFIKSGDKNDFIWTLKSSIVYSPENSAMTELALLLQEYTDLDINAGEDHEGCLVLELVDQLTLNFYLNSYLPDHLEVPSDLNEFYCIDISETFSIRACSYSGLARGIQTFRQINDIYQNKNIPSTVIIDWPRFSWRGALLDCSRHFMQVQFIKQFLDQLAYYKFNILHWHLVDDQGWRIEIPQYPQLTRVGAYRESGKEMYGGFYTEAEIREIIAHAKKLYITVVPEMELPGHCMAALASYPELACNPIPRKVPTEWGIYEDVYCAGSEKVFEFLENILHYLFDLFPSKYIHIGGDEVPKTQWAKCSKCQSRMKDNDLQNLDQLQAYFVKRIGKFITENERIFIGWDEILEGGIPKGAIVQSWRSMEGATHATRNGLQAICSPTSHCYFDYPTSTTSLEKVFEFEPIPQGLAESESRLILGGEACMWSERAPQHTVFSKVFPRIIALSSVLWTRQEVKKSMSFELFRSEIQGYHLAILRKRGVEMEI